MSTYQIYENGLDKFDNLLKKKKGCLFEETFCSIRFFDVTEKGKNTNKSSWYICETYLKGNCQADGYEVIVENYEGQEWHSKVLCLFTYQTYLMQFHLTLFLIFYSNITITVPQILSPSLGSSSVMLIQVIHVWAHVLTLTFYNLIYLSF